jgi:pimeloyl-ACP methyl ester carboxylesterase
VRGSHRPEGLARALRVLSLGAMPDHRPALSALRMPVVLMAGELDEKFCAVASELACSIPRAHVERVPGAGHNVPLEAPTVVAAWLRTLGERVVREGSSG